MYFRVIWRHNYPFSVPINSWKCHSLRLLHHIMLSITARKHTPLTRNTNDLWETVKHKGLGSKINSDYTPCLSFKGLLFVVEGLNVAIHVGHFYPGQYFISPSERTFCFLFLWFGPGWAVGRGEQPNPNVDAQLGRHSTECPDQTKAEREIQPFIYIHCGFACCVLDFQTPGGYSVWGTKTDGWLSIDILKGTFRINVRSICVNRVWVFDVWSTPIHRCTFKKSLKTDCPPVKRRQFLWWSIMTASEKVWNLSTVKITGTFSYSEIGWPQHCQLRHGTNLKELPWIACIQICRTLVHLGPLPLQLHAYFTIAETVCMDWGL